MSSNKLLFWPEELLLSTGQSPLNGFIVGWHLPSSTREWGTDTFISVGIVPFQFSDTMIQDDSSMEISVGIIEGLIRKEYDAIATNLKSIHCIQSCYCCSCESLTSDDNMISIMQRHLCDGCTRKVCFHDNKIKIIGLTYVQSTKGNDANTTLSMFSKITGSNDCVTVSFRQDEKYPKWFCQDDEKCHKQLLLYKGLSNIISNRDFTLYRHDNSPRNSVFAKEILTLLTHSGTIWRNIQDSLVLKQSVKKNDTLQENQHVSEDSCAKIAGNNERNKNENSLEKPNEQHTTFRLLERNSLLFKHSISCLTENKTRRIHDICFDLLKMAKVEKYVIAAEVSTEQKSRKCPLCRQQRPFLSQSHYRFIQHLISRYDDEIRFVVNRLAGVFIGSMLAYLWFSGVATTFLIQTIQREHAVLVQGLEWLENFPIGFKLNERLTSHVGNWIRTFWEIHQWIVIGNLTNDSIPYLMSFTWFLTGSMFGGSGLFALSFDMFRFISIDISLLSMVFQHVFYAELHLLAALWRLFRGKKRNVLRHRTDTMEYDSMQLLVGTILFAIALFLFTTVFVYHAFFQFFCFFVNGLSHVFLVIHQRFITTMPGTLILRKVRPGWFTTELFVQEEHSCTSSDTTFLRSKSS